MDAAELKQELGTVKEVIVNLEAELKQVSDKLTGAEPDEKVHLREEKGYLQRRLEVIEDEKRLLLKAVAVKTTAASTPADPSSPATPNSGHFHIDMSEVATKADLGALRAWMSKNGARKDDLTGVATKNDIDQLRLEFGGRLKVA